MLNNVNAPAVGALTYRRSGGERRLDTGAPRLMVQADPAHDSTGALGSTLPC